MKKYNDSLFGKNGRLENSENVKNWIKVIETLVPDVEPNPLREGERVKLNYYRIVAHPFWIDGNPIYKQFVEDNKDTIFTIEFEERQKKDKTQCVLREDTSPQKWIFNECDLVRLDG